MRFRVFGTLAAAVSFVVAIPGSLSHSPPVSAPFEYSVHVIVLDRNGNPAADPAPADLGVRIGGVPANVVRVARADEPLSVALLVDHCTRFPLELRTGLKAFVGAMAPAARVAVTTMGGAPTPLVRSTDDVATLAEAVGKPVPHACLGLHAVDAIREAYRSDDVRGVERAAVVAVIGHGGDASTEDVAALLAEIRESRAPLFVVRFPAEPTTRPGEQSNLAALLTEGPAFTGGQRLDLLSAGALRSQLERVAAALKSQLRVDVVLDEPPPAGRLLRLEVVATRKGHVALAPVAVRLGS